MSTLKVNDDEVYLLGDPHGMVGRLLHKIDERKIRKATVLCVGDLNVGIPGFEMQKLSNGCVERDIQFLCIRGNHDDPGLFRSIEQHVANVTLLPDYTVLEVYGTERWLCVGGAVSINRKDDDMIIGYSWWPGEKFNLLPPSDLPAQIDRLILHAAPPWLGPSMSRNRLRSWLERDPELWGELVKERDEIQQLVLDLHPRGVFCGHYHEHSHGRFEDIRGQVLSEMELAPMNPYPSL